MEWASVAVRSCSAATVSSTSGCGSGRLQLALEPAQHDADAGELLAHVVVQVARDARPLLFLRVDQAAGEILVLFV